MTEEAETPVATSSVPTASTYVEAEQVTRPLSADSQGAVGKTGQWVGTTRTAGTISVRMTTRAIAHGTDNTK